MNNFKMSDAFAFISVIDEGSFASAAKQIGLSSSVVSKRISRLEEELKVQLMHRTTRTVVLTEAGQQFYDSCKRIKTAVHEAAEELLAGHQQPSGLLRINAPMSFGQVYLVPAINDFVKAYPEIKVDLILGSQYASFIHSGLDLAIFIKELPDTPLLKSHKIAQRTTGIYGSPAYLRQYGVPFSPQALVDHNCLIYQSEPSTYVVAHQKHEWVFYDKKEKIPITVSGNLKINSNQALVKAALAGLGLVKLSSFLVAEEVKAGALVSVLEAYCPSDIDIHIAYPHLRFVPSKVNVFIDFLVERLRGEEDKLYISS
ncbi:MAG TPA: LysR family transcriptional regulator [Gammaproteobacteria bacterium]|jgi:DNA-binding transcriptional LysR family regulator|nr:LysR family transcriptional regulator [Gammaproteobacteria bacterium]